MLSDLQPSGREGLTLGLGQAVVALVVPGSGRTIRPDGMDLLWSGRPVRCAVVSPSAGIS